MLLAALSLVAVLWLPVAAGPPSAGALPGDDCVGAITDGWGDSGTYEVAVHQVRNPEWRLGRLVQVYAPVGAPGPRPVVFFSHGFGGNDAKHYDAFLRQIAGNGTVAVFTPYPTLSQADHMYDVLWAGDRAAVEELGSSLSIDTTRIGFFGHSFGGGATPWLYDRALDEGWGSNGAALSISAPWHANRITPQEIATFPASTRVLIQVYADDETNDHDIAIDEIWSHLTSIPDSNKDYLALVPDSRPGCDLVADHYVPATSEARGSTLDAFDPWGVWRRTEALGGCAWVGQQSACDIALGGGSPMQTDMGTWVVDGTPVEPLVWLAQPSALNCRPGDACRFPR